MTICGHSRISNSYKWEISKVKNWRFVIIVVIIIIIIIIN